jgi:DMSO reductase anchor subunit
MSFRDLNWRKDFFRLWIVASSIWMIFSGLVWVDKGCHELLPCSGMTLLPPVIALLLGMGFVWVFSGYAPKQNK